MEEWNAINQLLETTFRDAATMAFEEGQISEKTRHKYFWSVTENEVDVGLLTAENVNDRVLYFARALTDIDYNSSKASTYSCLFFLFSFYFLKNFQELT